ncbi:unnamed protein product [Dovyalis caffra]|uniref:Uncharacterized protein n=1 Tax=Dovyalis caffra TaxID=77055 RepID=A0AAV1SNJ8_9ROSI|nr:unnamed protein product [Dovyalis caffra]
MTEKVMLFDLTSLLSPQKIESMVRNMLGLLSIQFLSETMTSLGTKISNYLSTRFEFEVDIRASMSVIVVEVYRTRNIVYDQEIIGDVAALFPPETARFCEETIYKNFGCKYAHKVACSIRDAIGIGAKPDDDDFASLALKHAHADKVECTTRDPIVKVPIVDDEPIGLVQISAVVAMQIEGDFDKVNSSCPICWEFVYNLVFNNDVGLVFRLKIIHVC